MKKLYLIIALVFATSAIADEKKTITPQEFATTLSEVPNKVGNFLTNEVEKTKAYQTKVWSETMKTWPWNKIFKKDKE
tara:strand:+ start:63 stop:296 length:234 start_codon:yes stop_codon:yes gene_type:complete